MSIKAKTIRLNETLIKQIDKKATEHGIGFNNMVGFILQEYFSMKQEPIHELISKIYTWLNNNYSPQNFPEDITEIVFKRIREDELWFSLYNQSVEALNKTSVNRRLGLSIKRILLAEVKSRSLPISDKKSLIKSYSFLKPKN